jgi:hypothetical protein
VIAAACERIFPNDGSGPGATEAGVVVYIDRQLAGPYGRDKYRYTKGPWVESIPEHGYQGKDNAPRNLSPGPRGFGGFDRPFKQDDQLIAKLKSNETTLLPDAAQPHHRGHVLRPHARRQRRTDRLAVNRFPGPADVLPRTRSTNTTACPTGPKPVSLQQVVGHPVHGWEEEKDTQN